MSDTPIDLKDYRQPLVTSVGVILGFLLGFLGQWVTEDTFELRNAADVVTFIGCVGGAMLLMLALFRMLTPPRSADRAGRYYRTTLTVYVGGVVIPFAAILLAAFI